MMSYGKEQSYKTYKKSTNRRLAEPSDISGETINMAWGTPIYEGKVSTLDALANVLKVKMKVLFDNE